MTVAPAPVLRDEQIFELLHDRLSELIGAHGVWTLVARAPGDTEVIFHALKAREIAVTLADSLIAPQAALRGESVGEPTALSWNPAPISRWNEPVAVDAPTDALTDAVAADPADELAEASAAWIDRASATLAAARLSP
jgi:hypothetical protein